MHEAQQQGPGYQILRRRIAIILGQWLPVKEGLDRALVYRIFEYMLSDADSLNDQVVRLTAGKQLANVIDPFEFTAGPFTPFASNLLAGIMKLIEEIELTETKIALLTTISIMVTKMEQHVRDL